MKKTILQLETLTCPSCIRKIEGTLTKQEGVSLVSVKFNTSKVEVDHDETLISQKAVSDFVSKLGYHVLGVK
ncbi:MAG: heavy metal-associated domain-containing protein [Acholeplasmataceae bacterium]|jgi:copper chaperone CopZ|nr:heavy metal-associated domain-containing protein [Acholeplasmataceae bacterium]